MRYKENKKNSENINSFRFFEAACMRSAFYVQRPDLIFLHTNTPDLRNGGNTDKRRRQLAALRYLVFQVLVLSWLCSCCKCRLFFSLKRSVLGQLVRDSRI